jgi:hypothetical protein
MNSDNSQSKMKKQIRYSTALALTAAVAAYEINNRTVVRDTVTVDGVETRSNRQIIMDSLNGPFVVNEFHQTQAEAIVTYLQQTGLMQTLTNGKIDSFIGNIIELLSEQEINHRELGLLAWAPKVADDYQRKDAVREISARYESSSRYIGKVGDKILTHFTLIESRFVHSLECYAVYGHDEHNNLIFYWAKDQKKIVNAGRIQGRVKAQQTDSRRGDARVTTLNYVKAV